MTPFSFLSPSARKQQARWISIDYPSIAQSARSQTAAGALQQTAAATKR
jgi:hypothetical protein